MCARTSILPLLLDYQSIVVINSLLLIFSNDSFSDFVLKIATFLVSGDSVNVPSLVNSFSLVCIIKHKLRRGKSPGMFMHYFSIHLAITGERVFPEYLT